MPRVRTRVSAGSHARVRVRFRAARSGLRLRPHQKGHDARGHRLATPDDVALSRIVAGGGRADGGSASGLYAAGEGRAAGEKAGHSRIVDQERHGELSDAVVQRPRRKRGLEPVEGVGFRHGRVRIHGQSGECRRGAGGVRRFEVLRVHTARFGAGQNPELAHLWRAGDQHQGPLRRSEPVVRRDRRQVWLGVCEREHEAVLRRRLQEHGVRNRRAIRVAHPPAYRGAHGLRLVADQDTKKAIRNSSSWGWCQRRDTRCTAPKPRVVRPFPRPKRPGWISSSR